MEDLLKGIKRRKGEEDEAENRSDSEKADC